MAHWDHLGKHERRSDGDNINNGAVDNATGMAGILEIAEKFAHQVRKPKRSVTVPGRDAGGIRPARLDLLRGAPAFPLDKIVGGINIDAMQRGRQARDVVVIGAGTSRTGRHAEDAVLDAAGPRDPCPNRNPENGYFYRSDHFNLAKKGVPMLYVDSGIDLVEGGIAAGEAAGKDYTDKRYHKPSDEYARRPGTSPASMHDLQALLRGRQGTRQRRPTGPTGTTAIRSRPRATR